VSLLPAVFRRETVILQSVPRVVKSPPARIKSGLRLKSLQRRSGRQSPARPATRPVALKLRSNTASSQRNDPRRNGHSVTATVARRARGDPSTQGANKLVRGSTAGIMVTSSLASIPCAGWRVSRAPRGCSPPWMRCSWLSVTSCACHRSGRRAPAGAAMSARTTSP
jgi:hypothetical protein